MVITSVTATKRAREARWGKLKMSSAWKAAEELGLLIINDHF